jgi:hypothetical protein
LVFLIILIIFVMKNLDFAQMENLQGGKAVKSCAKEGALFFLGIISIIASAPLTCGVATGAAAIGTAAAYVDYYACQKIN